jgi:hypothetical protein
MVRGTRYEMRNLHLKGRILIKKQALHFIGTSIRMDRRV